MDFTNVQGPISENGKKLSSVLLRWIQNSPEYAGEKLKRVFTLYVPKMVNLDSFICAIYGLEAVDESPQSLAKNKTTVLTVQHALEMSIDKKKIIEVIKALEWTENYNVIRDILKLTEKSLPAEEAVNTDASSTRTQRDSQMHTEISSPSRFTSISGSLESNKREILWDSDSQWFGAIEVCGKKIIVGWNSGDLTIYDSGDVTRQAVLTKCSQSVVTSVQCTCSQIIAGYADGSVCAISIQNGNLVKRILIGDGHDGIHAVCMRWKTPNLIIGTQNNRVQMWQYCDSEFTYHGGWDTNVELNRLEFNNNFVALLPVMSKSVIICNLTGCQLNSVSSSDEIADMILLGDHLITGGKQKVLQLWDVQGGQQLMQLEGHTEDIVHVEARNEVILSGDSFGTIIIWSVKEALKRNALQLSRVSVPGAGLDCVCLGPNYFVAQPKDQARLIVMDFPVCAV